MTAWSIEIESPNLPDLRVAQMWFSVSPVVEQVRPQLTKPGLQRCWGWGEKATAVPLMRWMKLSANVPMWIDDSGPYQSLSTYAMVPCSPGGKEGWGHSKVWVQILPQQRKSQNRNLVQFKKNIVMFLASDLVIYLVYSLWKFIRWWQYPSNHPEGRGKACRQHGRSDIQKK